MKKIIVLILVGQISLVSCKKEEAEPDNTTTTTSTSGTTCISETEVYFVKAKLDGVLKEFPTQKGLSIYTDAIDREMINVLANESLFFSNTEVPGFSMYIQCGFPPQVGVYDAGCCNASYIDYLYYYEENNYDCWNHFSNGTSDECQIEITKVTEDCGNYILEGTFFANMSGNEDTTVVDYPLTEGEFRIIL